MSSSDLSKALGSTTTGSIYGTGGGLSSGAGNGGNPYGYTVNIGSGVGIGSVTISADEIKALTATIPARVTLSVDNGDPSVVFREMQDDGTTVRAQLEPDNGMSASDLAKIMSLILVSKDSNAHLGVSLKPVSYIRKHNLERHFRFSV